MGLERAVQHENGAKKILEVEEGGQNEQHSSCGNKRKIKRVAATGCQRGEAAQGQVHFLLQLSALLLERNLERSTLPVLGMWLLGRGKGRLPRQVGSRAVRRCHAKGCYPMVGQRPWFWRHQGQRRSRRLFSSQRSSGYAV